jgi:NAD(P)H-hydrate epimerase
MSTPKHPWIRIPTRPDDSHKRTFGHVVVLASMAGAAGLAGLAALRSGAGVVTIGTAHEAVDRVGGVSPCLMVVPLPSRDGLIARAARATIGRLVAAADVVIVGPGLGQSDDLNGILAWLYADVAAPMLVDADALNGLALANVDLREHAGPRILTPHLGEFRRLSRQPDLSSEAARLNVVPFAAEYDVTMLLKGPQSLVTDGHESFINTTGNSGMATAGTGDVLSGIIGALIGQGLQGAEAAATGAYLHGLAGDLAASRLGSHSMIATDLIDELPNAFLKLRTP